MRTGFHRSGLLLSDDRTAVISFVSDEGIESVDVPDSVTDIPSSLFSGCAALKRIKLSSSLRYLPDRLFEGCASLEKIIMPPEVDSIGRAAFSGCASLKSIPFRAGLTELSEDVFSYCTSLVSLVIPDSVERIKSGAAADCTKLAALVLPSSLKTLEAGAFAGCSSLRHIRISEDNDVFYVDEKDGCLYRREKDGDVVVLRPCDFEKTAAKLIKTDEDEEPSGKLEKEDLSEIDRYEADARKAANEAESRKDEANDEIDNRNVGKESGGSDVGDGQADLRKDEASGGEKIGDATYAVSSTVETIRDITDDSSIVENDDDTTDNAAAEKSDDHGWAENSVPDLAEDQADETTVENAVLNPAASDAAFSAETIGESDAKEPVAILSKKNDNSDTAENRRTETAEAAAGISVDESEEPDENRRLDTVEVAAGAPDRDEAELQHTPESAGENDDSGKEEEEIINFNGGAMPDEIEICKFNNKESSDVMETKTMPSINQSSVDEIFKKASEVKSENVRTADDGFKPISQDELNMLVAESDILRQNTPADITVSASAQEHEHSRSGDSLLKRIGDAAKKYECISLSNAGGKSDWNDSLYVFAEGLVLDASGNGHFSKALESCSRRIAAIHKYSKIFMYYGLPFGDDEFAHMFTGFIAERNTVYACSASKMSLLSEDARRFASLAGISLERDQIECTNERAGNPEAKLIKLILQDDYSA
ncbi:leucine-rich repeat domain-containing protein [Treponema sp. Marseille-Q4130]|uniref:leucine-rich repeat domain-containing protein n=1 Tax=Treponema sp. Marseille-Q4130 TaxID=2766702 RepID=UPI001652B67C|nr:leucine-rich repeat domain-containing protein [Treponema sp. Marseille-Q4130]MBC6719149.1 leucine-rich repeat protein [Treponema sp. Marseille-Q4130]